ncbi:MAG: EscU/YscU/HrcU family type III secretion system export apparatus switch protein, partial [Ilumatobacter sp.]
MSNADRHSKTELPTKQRLKKARREGQVARSGDLASWIVLALSAMLVPRYIAWLISRTSRQFTFVRAAESGATDEMLGAVGHHVVVDLALLLALPLGLSLILGIALSLAQTGIVAAPDALKPKLSRLSLKQGFKRTMS